MEEEHKVRQETVKTSTFQPLAVIYKLLKLTVQPSLCEDVCVHYMHTCGQFHVN